MSDEAKPAAQVVDLAAALKESLRVAATPRQGQQLLTAKEQLARGGRLVPIAGGAIVLPPEDMTEDVDHALEQARAEGAAEAITRIRRDFLAWMRIERAEGRAMTPARFERALNRIIPPVEG